MPKLLFRCETCNKNVDHNEIVMEFDVQFLDLVTPQVMSFLHCKNCKELDKRDSD